MECKCKNCRYFGNYYEKGSILITSGTFYIDEPFITCLKIHYYVLATVVADANKCKNYTEKIIDEK